MNSLIDYLFVIFTLISAFNFSFGVNIKKWWGWVQVLAGGILGVVIAADQGFSGQVFCGSIFLFLTLWLGNFR